MIKHRAWIVAGLVALLASPVLHAGDANPFEGMRIHYLVTTKPGGGHDTYARLIAPFLERQLPGTQVIVENVPGAGHKIGVNRLYAAEPDGLTIGAFGNGVIYDQLLGEEGVQYDLTKLSWIGGAAQSVRVLVVGAETDITSPEELIEREEPLVLAVSGVRGTQHLHGLLLAAALDLDLKIIPNFNGSEAELSIRRGEVEGTIGSYESLAPLVASGDGRLLLRVGGDERPELRGVPDARDLVADAEARALLAPILAYGDVTRLTAAPPGVPPEWLEALRAAYQGALRDPELLAQAQALGRSIVLADADTVAQMVDATLAAPPETIASIRRLFDCAPADDDCP